jgi:hypothetical protein
VAFFVRSGAALAADEAGIVKKCKTSSLFQLLRELFNLTLYVKLSNGYYK